MKKNRSYTAFAVLLKCWVWFKFIITKKLHNFLQNYIFRYAKMQLLAKILEYRPLFAFFCQLLNWLSFGEGERLGLPEERLCDCGRPFSPRVFTRRLCMATLGCHGFIFTLDFACPRYASLFFLFLLYQLLALWLILLPKLI